MKSKPIDFFYAFLIAESVGKGAVPKAATKIDINTIVLILFSDTN
jgi:hypothetical protein